MWVCTGMKTKGILIVMAMLTMVAMVYAQPQPWQIGDYRNLTSATASITSTLGWQKYTSTGWRNLGLTESTLSQLSPFHRNIYVANNLRIGAEFELFGNFTGGANTKITIGGIGTTFTLGEGGNCTLHSMDVNALTRFTNKGTTTFTAHESELNLLYLGTWNDQEGGQLDNYGTINLNGSLNASNETLIISRQNGKIVGSGWITTANPGDVQFRIANAGGWDEAFQLTRTHDVHECCYFFDGSTDQVTGNIPVPVFSLTVDSGHKLTLTKQIDLEGRFKLLQGWPHVRVVGGSTIDLGEHMILSLSSDIGSRSTFYLEPEATLITAYPDGISSFTDPNGSPYRVGYGAIRTRDVEYSSEADYVFSGTGVPGQRQESGCFVTQPTANTVRNITNNGSEKLLLCPNFQPLEVSETWTGDFNHVPNLTTEGYIKLPTLPVTLSYFNAFFNGFDSVMLQWETQSETNNLGFYLLRSVEPDATRANVISGLVPATNSPQGAVYCFEDSSLYEDGIYYYWLQDVSFDGQIELHGPVLAQVTLQGGASQTPNLPLKTGLIRNYPNPFNPSTQLEYYLEKEADVDFKVYNLKGQLVDQITLRHQDSGFHRYTWTPQLSSGIYLIRFTAEGRSNTRKVILSK